MHERIGTLALLVGCIFVTVPASAADKLVPPVTKKNWHDHPAIVDIRKLVQENEAELLPIPHGLAAEIRRARRGEGTRRAAGLPRLTVYSAEMRVTRLGSKLGMALWSKRSTTSNSSGGTVGGGWKEKR